MKSSISVSKAVRVGLLVVNGPVLLLLCGPLFVFAYLEDHGLVPKSYNWVGLPVFIGGFILAWLWWSLSVPKWRLWAYQRVDDIHKLKEHAISADLTWPNDHMFARTEIKSLAHAERERELDPLVQEDTDAKKNMVSEALAKHAGFVMVHAAVIVSVNEPGELICPFIVITKGSGRQSIEFESKTQDEAVDRAWSSLTEYRAVVDLWAMAREGLVAGPNGKEDVLVVAAWERGMSEAIVFTQRFLPKDRGGFAVYGPVSIQSELEREQVDVLAEWFLQGIAQHPKGQQWHSWRSPNNSFESDALKTTRASR